MDRGASLPFEAMRRAFIRRRFGGMSCTVTPVGKRPAFPKHEEPCVASFDIACERTPTGYAVLQTLEVPLRADSGWGLGGGDVEWPLD